LNAKASATKVCPGCSARYPPDALFCPNDGSPLTASPFGDPELGAEGVGEGHDSYLGREISGHIEIRKLAGVGAMGRVYRAFQKGIDRDVAVKVLHRELSANQQLVTRFHREAKVASRLQHPNVVQVHLAGQLPDGAMYIVMEYLDGLSLQSALLAAGGPIPLVRALHIALQICDAAGEAHSQGVIHRDLKPENVMLIRRGEDEDFVKVLDFGIARLNWGEQSMATAAGLIFGTARYISPEGAQGEAVGPAGDVYAIATLLYQMLAGRTPFEGDQAVALLVQQIHDAPPPLRSHVPAASLPDSIADVIMQNLSKRPEERAPDARTFGRSLVEAAKSLGLTPEDLVPRSSLFVPPARLSDPGGLPPALAETRGSAPPLGPTTVRDAVPAGVTALPPHGVAANTQKWAPPEGLQALLTPTPLRASSSVTPPVAAAGAFPPAARSQSASVDPTLDDEVLLHAAGTPAAPRTRTELGEPLPAALTPTVPPAEPGAPPGRAYDQVRSTYDEAPRRPRRILGLVILTIVLLAIGVSVGAYRLGYFAVEPHRGSLEDDIARATDALKHGRWDAPPGDNVRDVTNDGLGKWPREPRLLDIRARATDELVKEAVGRKFSGNLPDALHLARLANELDPSDTTAQHLVEEYERATAAAGVDAALSPSATVGPLPPPPRSGGSHTQAGATSRIVVESTAARPKVGHPVTFVARVVSVATPAVTKPSDDAHFVINGPGLAPDTKLAAIPASAGAYQTTFTGFEPGKYDITFDARVDGAVIKATKTITVDADAHAPFPGSPSASASAPPPAPSGKWL